VRRHGPTQFNVGNFALHLLLRCEQRGGNRSSWVELGSGGDRLDACAMRSGSEATTCQRRKRRRRRRRGDRACAAQMLRMTGDVRAKANCPSHEVGGGRETWGGEAEGVMMVVGAPCGCDPGL
jgi:hypothetical protein